MDTTATSLPVMRVPDTNIKCIFLNYQHPYRLTRERTKVIGGILALTMWIFRRILLEIGIRVLCSLYIMWYIVFVNLSEMTHCFSINLKIVKYFLKINKET